MGCAAVTTSLLCRPLFEGVFSTQTYASLGHIALSVPMLGAGQLGNIQCKKPHETRFLRSVTAALPMSDPPCPPEAYGSNFVDLPRLVHERLLVFRVCHLTQLRHPDYRVWSGKACRADHGLSHQTYSTDTQRVNVSVAPAMNSQLLGCSLGRDLSRVTVGSGSASGCERSARTRLWCSPAVGHRALAVILGATFRGTERDHFVGTSRRT